MSHAVVDRVAQFLAHQQISSSRVLVAVSGGGDSVALLRVLDSLRHQYQLDLAVIHVDHGLRPDSGDDAAWVSRLCDQLAIPCHQSQVMLPRNEAGQVSEELARHARYQCFEETARRTQAAWIATAHTADDQVETVLHHILRGTGLKGLAGIPEQRQTANATLIRPLLECPRAQIEDYLRQLQQDYRTDLSNQSLIYSRNRIRHQLLPQLRTDYNPAVDQALRRLASHAAEAQDFINTLALQLLDSSLLESQGQIVRLRVAGFANQPSLLVREAFVMLWTRQNWGRQDMTAEHWHRLAQMVSADTAPAQTFPGAIQVERRQGVLRLEPCPPGAITT